MPAQAQVVAVEAERQPGHDVLPLFVGRWSPRAFRPEPVPRRVLESMAEAARWAPSSLNLQPWRFFVASTGPARDLWNTAVGERNRAWSDRAGGLAWVVAKTTLGPNPFHPPETPNRHALFDAGMAAIQFVLEGERHGVRSHFVGGIDPARAHAILGLAPDEEVVCAIVVGYPADPATLPDGLRQRERPSGRKPLAEVARFE
jgi:nitroreductase